MTVKQLGLSRSQFFREAISREILRRWESEHYGRPNNEVVAKGRSSSRGGGRTQSIGAYAALREAEIEESYCPEDIPAEVADARIRELLAS